MTSNKIVFSLASFVVMLALAFVSPYALAGDFTTELSVEDVSFADKSFPEYQHDNQVSFDGNTIVHVKFDKVVDYRAGIVGNNNNDDVAEFADTGVFTHHDVVVLIYNQIGQVFATRSGDDEVVIAPRDPNRHDGKNYTITFNTRDPAPRIEDHNRVLVYIKQGGVTAVDPAVAAADSKNAEGSVAFDLVYQDGRSPVPAEDDGFFNTDRRYINRPSVYGISTTALRARAGVTKPFQVTILLSEKPKEGTLTTDHVHVTEGKATEIAPLTPVNPRTFGSTVRSDAPPTGRHWLFYAYLVTIEPKFENKNDIVIKINAFEDLVKPTSRYDLNAPYKYTPPTSENEYAEGLDKLTVKVGKEVLKDKTSGFKVPIVKDKVIPGSGYLVLTEETAGSSVHPPPGAIDASPKAHERTPTELLYNVVDVDFPNLETFLANGGVIDVVSPHPLVISEVMWGSDASLDDGSKSQWIELYNAGAEFKTAGDAGAETAYFVFYGPNETR